MPQGGGIKQSVTLDYAAGKFGKRNINNVVAPARISSIPKGKWNVYVSIIFSKPNPVPGGQPPMIITTVDTAIVSGEIK